MYITFNKQKMHVQITCGIQEHFSPTEQTAEVDRLVKELKDKMSNFNQTVLSPGLEQIEALVNKINSAASTVQLDS